jgi:hypothetical protein
MTSAGSLTKRLAAIGTLVMLAAATVLWLEAAQSTHQRLESLADTGAQRSARVTAQRISDALDAGVPLAQLEGVPEFLRKSLTQAPGVARLCLRVAGRWVAAYPEPCQDSGPAASGPQPGPQPGLHAAAVLHQGRPLAPGAEVWAQRQSPPLPQPSLAQLGALLLAALAVLLVGHDVARQAIARGPRRREAALRQFAQGLAAGRFDSIEPPSTSLRRDAALLALRAELRELHEERQRLRRLLDVLRAAETDSVASARFDAMRAELDGPDHFADNVLAVHAAPQAAAPGAVAPMLALLLGAGLGGWAGWPLWLGAVAAAAAGVAATALRRADLARCVSAGAAGALALRWLLV